MKIRSSFTEVNQEDDNDDNSDDYDCDESAEDSLGNGNGQCS